MSEASDLRLHRNYLSDPNRVGAYARAIASVVREGDRVLDLASGTSILGLLALRAGAAHVTSIDVGPIATLGRDIAAHNGAADRLDVVRGHSTQVDLPRSFDVILSDQVGCFAFDAGGLTAYADARERFLVPGARFLPLEMTAHVVPLCSPGMHEMVAFWGSRVEGVDLAPGRVHAANVMHYADFREEEVLGSEGVVHTWDMARASTAPVRGACTLEIRREGTLHGFGGWASARLTADITLICDPRDSRPINRSSVFFPLEHPVDVLPGDEAHVTWHIVPRRHLVAWTTEVRRGEAVIGRCEQSTLKGAMLELEDLRKHAPAWVPSLSRRGHAVREGLALLHEGAALGDLRAFLEERFPDLAGDEENLSLLVERVVDAGVRP